MGIPATKKDTRTRDSSPVHAPDVPMIRPYDLDDGSRGDAGKSRTETLDGMRALANSLIDKLQHTNEIPDPNTRARIEGQYMKQLQIVYSRIGNWAGLENPEPEPITVSPLNEMLDITFHLTDVELEGLQTALIAIDIRDDPEALRKQIASMQRRFLPVYLVQLNKDLYDRIRKGEAETWEAQPYIRRLAEEVNFNYRQANKRADEGALMGDGKSRLRLPVGDVRADMFEILDTDPSADDDHAEA